MHFQQVNVIIKFKVKCKAEHEHVPQRAFQETIF